MNRVDEVLEQIDCLPPAPRILPQLLSLLSKVDTDTSQVVDLVAFDPGLTSKVMRTCNSAFFASSRPADDVAEAVNRLGFQAVYQVVAAVAGAQCLRPSKASGLNADQMWRHCVTTAFAAQFVAEDAGEDSGLFFTAGLLHDIGKLVLASARAVENGRPEAGAAPTSPQQELSRFGVDHAAVGGRLLERWNFSPQLAASVRFHHTPSAANGAARAAACIALADALAHDLEQGPDGEAGVETVAASPLMILGLGPEAPSRYRERLQENFQFVEGMCRL